LKAAITPFFGGDLKIDQHHFALEPVSEVDLFSNIFSRNIIFEVNGETYFWNGQTFIQQNDEITAEYGLLYQKTTRKNKLFSVITTSYIPLDAMIEIHEIVIVNNSKKPLNLAVTTAIPLYGRSADNLRDHRHVTSLLNRIIAKDGGIYLKPSLSFDERGHKRNETVYSVFAGSDDLDRAGYIPVLDDFIGGGTMHFPKGLANVCSKECEFAGFEAMGAIAFKPYALKPGKSVSLYLNIGIHESEESARRESEKYLNAADFASGLDKVEQYFTNYCQGLGFSFASKEVSDRLDWVVLQPMLRRYFGNSFLPHHDYGRGGRGWRDLWQDLLSLTLMNDPSVRDLLLNNFRGVRIDGSNATIIGDGPGEFAADRNSITRIWSDHGAWPMLTTQIYMDTTGDLGILLSEQEYFHDRFSHYTHKASSETGSHPETGTDGKPYRGTVLEHLLLQNLVGHHNVGEHGFVRLENADWNDGLDMAAKQGETVAFTHMYASNLRVIAKYVRMLEAPKLEIMSDLLPLLEENADLGPFFDKVEHFSGEKSIIKREDLAEKLTNLAASRIEHLHKKAFHNGSYQSYFNNNGIDPDLDGGMMLTGQAMALLNETATRKQAEEIAKTTRKYLFDENCGGYRLNTDHHEILMDMGRAFGFAYGNKENGSVFSHMAIMYAYGLYEYDLVKEGREAFMTLLNQAEKREKSTLMGIPEYFNNRGVGKYSYLTGSASWLLLLLYREVFGIVFKAGVLHLEPKLTAADFIDGKAIIRTNLFSKLTKVTYFNPKALEYGEYRISSVRMGDKEVVDGLTDIDADIEVMLDEKL